MFDKLNGTSTPKIGIEYLNLNDPSIIIYKNINGVSSVWIDPKYRIKDSAK